MTAAKEALEMIRTAVSNATTTLSGADYRIVLEELSADVTGHLDALDEEIGDDAEAE